MDKNHGGGGGDIIEITQFAYMFIQPLLGLRFCLKFCYVLYPKLLIFCRNREIIFAASI
jgi:hypothetical protein